MNPKTFEGFVRRAVEGIPEELKAALDNVDIVIEARPDPELLEEMGIEPPLLGLYLGVPLPEREMGMTLLPDKISIYRDEILDLGLTGRDLIEEIRITVVHEIGHYFGFDDHTLEDLGY